MGENSRIEWTHHTFSPWIGCQKVSQACANCYAEKETFVRVQRSRGRELWGTNSDRHRTSENYWKQPLKWNREAEKAGERRRVFCASLSDVFEDHPAIWPGWRADLGKLILDTPNLDRLLLTKRPENVYRMLPVFWINLWEPYGMAKNVWLGTTVENQELADQRIPALLNLPARVKFLSCEPLLGRVNLQMIKSPAGGYFDARYVGADGLRPAGKIDWVIGGGESGPSARFCYSEYARSLRDQCAEAGTAFFWKQWGEFLPDDQNPEIGAGTGGIKVGKKAAGRLLDGREYNEFPEAR